MLGCEIGLLADFRIKIVEFAKDSITLKSGQTKKNFRSIESWSSNPEEALTTAFMNSLSVRSTIFSRKVMAMREIF